MNKIAKYKVGDVVTILSYNKKGGYIDAVKPCIGREYKILQVYYETEGCKYLLDIKGISRYEKIWKFREALLGISLKKKLKMLK